MDVRVSWASLDVDAGPGMEVQVAWAEFDTRSAPFSVEVSWAELDVGAPAPPPKPTKRPGGSVAGYHRSSVQQYEIPVRLGDDATDADEEEIILALLLEIAAHVV